MTEKERADHPEYTTTGGYLKKLDRSDAYRKWWERLDEQEKGIIKTIPNFDPGKFEAITGIRVE
jgi:hypothetical protein